MQSLSKDTSTIEESYKISQITSNTLFVLMKTTVKCDNLICKGEKLPMKTLVRNCVDADDCTVVSSAIASYLENTFAERGMNYKFVAEYLGEPYIELQRGACRSKVPEYLFMPLEESVIKMRLEICNG
jgi:hypothetical protein